MTRYDLAMETLIGTSEVAWLGGGVQHPRVLFRRVCVFRVGYIYFAEPIQVSDTCMIFLQNPQKYRVLYGCCTERTKVSDTV